MNNACLVCSADLSISTNSNANSVQECECIGSSNTNEFHWLLFTKRYTFWWSEITDKLSTQLCLPGCMLFFIPEGDIMESRTTVLPRRTCLILYRYSTGGLRVRLMQNGKNVIQVVVTQACVLDKLLTLSSKLKRLTSFLFITSQNFNMSYWKNYISRS